MEFVEVGRTEEVVEGTMKEYDVMGKSVLIAKYNDKYYAIGGRCTHMGGELSKGKQDGKIITCPRHGSKFDITTGESISGPKIAFLKLKTKRVPSYEVRTVDGAIEVEV